MVILQLNILLLLLVTVSSVTFASELELVKVAKEQRTLYSRDKYLIELLERALAKKNYHFDHIPVHPHQQRTLLKLSKGDVDIHWGMTSPEREEIATAIHIPLFKGLIGWRIALIKAQAQSRFNQLTTNDLKQLNAVQGHDWPDTKVLAQNGFRVKPFANYPAMFSMISRGQVDYFPRSVIEVSDELAAHQKAGIVIEQQHALVYPAAFYFFVNKEREQLAEDLEQGLNQLIKEGEFERLFNQYFASVLAELNIPARQVHRLGNNYLPSSVPIERTELWYKLK